MTYAPASLVELGLFWADHGGVNLGIVGDQSHASKGTSYHLGKDQLLPGAYSADTARDKAGLTNAASAIDLGRLNGSFAELRTFSVWLVGRCRADCPVTRDVREVIYSPDGRTVLRWDRERGFASRPQPGEADNSHLLHTHIGTYRDSQKRGKVALFAPYFEEPTVKVYRVKGEDWKASGLLSLFVAPDPTSPKVAVLPKGAVFRSIAEAEGSDGGSWRLTEHDGHPSWFRFRAKDGSTGDAEPLVQGGDPVVDATLTAYIARVPNPGIAAAVAADRAKAKVTWS